MEKQGEGLPAGGEVTKSATLQSRVGSELPTTAVSELREAHLPPNLKVQYKASWNLGLHMVQGKGCRLYTVDGDEYLDCVNNVAHVGHCHPKVVAAVASQLATLNTNTRYLSTGLVNYSKSLSATMPGGLEVVFMVTSGSESNDLALRLIRAAGKPGAQHIAVMGSAYHGHSLATLGISPYKFEGRGGFPCPPHVHIIPCPDPYRGKHVDGKAAAREAIRQAAVRGGNISAFFFESMPSCAGQIIFPCGYLRDACDEFKRAGALCVADEVQTGFGRAGRAFWGFEAEGVVPDIVTLGKGIGNGFPMGAVVTTREVSAAFANGMEYFNTGGGCNAACAAGQAVLDVIAGEKLQDHAAAIGSQLLAGLGELAAKCNVMGNVRGAGLFLGIEVVTDRHSKVPAPHVADWIVAACMTAHHVLLSTDGPFDNVIKIKPPMCFSAEDAEELLHAFQDILLDQLPPRLAQLLELDRMAAEAREAQAALKRKLEDVMRSGGVGGTGTPLSGAASKATPGGADARPGKPEHAPHHVTGPGDSEPRLVPAAGARWWHELEPYGSSLKAVVGLGVGLGLMVSVLVALKRK